VPSSEYRRRVVLYVLGMQRRCRECRPAGLRVGTDRSGVTPGTLGLSTRSIACGTVRSTDDPAGTAGEVVTRRCTFTSPLRLHFGGTPASSPMTDPSGA
jgi:hypothetical protein